MPWNRLRGNDFSVSGFGRPGFLRVRRIQPSSLRPRRLKLFLWPATKRITGRSDVTRPGTVDLSAYSHLAGVKYPRTVQVDILKKPPSRPYKSFAVLECQPAPHSKPDEVLAGLKDKAREIGADAIILCQPVRTRDCPVYRRLQQCKP